MLVELIDAKNGEKTLKVNSLFLHSSYNPTKEIERFVSTLSFPFIPKNIVIIEPGLSYCVKFLKEKYPSSKIGYISFSKDLPKKENFDFELDFLNNIENFDNYITSKFTEIDFFNTCFISWPASAKAFPELNESVWKSIKKATEHVKTLLITREYFEKKWLLNSAMLLKNINSVTYLNSKINVPILICASGPSLKNNLQIIKNNQNKFFIIALSSSLSVLLKNEIIPDLVFSTDGGFWAGEHLKKCKTLNIAIPLEAYCPKKILKNNNILPLSYNDGISSIFKNISTFSFGSCERNGTVSGSALSFAISNSNQNIYFLGLDLCNQNGYQHTQPNELEINNSFNDNRIKTKEKRIYPGSLHNSSLEIYQDWFKCQNFPENRIFRIIDAEYKKNSLGKIIDLTTNDFYFLCCNLTSSNKKNFFTLPEIIDQNSCKQNTKNIYKYLSTYLQNNEVLQQLFPLSYVLLSHLDKNSEQYDLQKCKINKELNKLLNKLEKILND